jgi:antitoxin MazE
MAHLVRIGNSFGIRIPKVIIEQARLHDGKLSLKVVDGGLLITPEIRPRANWSAQVQALGMEERNKQWLDAHLTNDEAIEW